MLLKTVVLEAYKKRKQLLNALNKINPYLEFIEVSLFIAHYIVDS